MTSRTIETSTGPRRTMSIAKALGWGFSLAFAAFIVGGLAAFTTGADLSFLGVSTDTVTSDETRRTNLSVNVLVPLLLGLVASVVIWVVGSLAGVIRTGRS